jgi:hypothetical protein
MRVSGRKPRAAWLASWGVAGVAAVAWVLAFALPARAQSRVAVTELSGRGRDEAASVLREALTAAAFVVVDASTQGVDDVAAAAALCARLEAMAALGGEAARRGERWRFELWVRDATGTEILRVRRSARGRRGLEDAVRDVLAALGALPPPVMASSPSAAAVEPNGTAVTNASVARESATPTRSTSTHAPDANTSSATPAVRFAAWLGAGARTRVVTLIAPGGADAGYVAPGFFELALGAEAWFFDTLFVRAAATSSAGLRSRQVEPGLVTLDSWFASASADLGARLTLDGAFELGLAAGVGLDRYALPFNEQVPTLSYAYLRPGALLAARILDEALVLEAEGGLRFSLTTGDLDALYGGDHGVRGLDVTLRLRGVVGPGLLWRVEGGYRAYALAVRTIDGTIEGRDVGYHVQAHAGWTF